MPKDKIFINYRRDDAGGFAGRLADSLGAWFGPGRVFRDVTGIDYGDDFARVIDEKLDESGALVVVIGERRASVTKPDGTRRLDDPDDYVIREISAALHGTIAVVPVLIGKATMPRPDELPAGLADLCRRNAMTVTDERWEFDIERLAKVLAIDVPGSVAQRRLDRLKWLALGLLIVSGLIATVAFCRALVGHALPATGLRAAGFAPIVSAIPFISIVVAAAAILNALPLMEPPKRKFGWAAIVLAATGTLGAFVHYALTNVETPDLSLIANFGVSTLLTFALLALMGLAGFRAK